MMKGEELVIPPEVAGIATAFRNNPPHETGAGQAMATDSASKGRTGAGSGPGTQANNNTGNTDQGTQPKDANGTTTGTGAPSKENGPAGTGTGATVNDSGTSTTGPRTTKVAQPEPLPLPTSTPELAAIEAYNTAVAKGKGVKTAYADAAAAAETAYRQQGEGEQEAAVNGSKAADGARAAYEAKQKAQASQHTPVTYIEVGHGTTQDGVPYKQIKDSNGTLTTVWNYPDGTEVKITHRALPPGYTLTETTKPNGSSTIKDEYFTNAGSHTATTSYDQNGNWTGTTTTETDRNGSVAEKSIEKGPHGTRTTFKWRGGGYWISDVDQNGKENFHTEKNADGSSETSYTAPGGYIKTVHRDTDGKQIETIKNPDGSGWVKTYAPNGTQISSEPLPKTEAAPGANNNQTPAPAPAPAPDAVPADPNRPTSMNNIPGQPVIGTTSTVAIAASVSSTVATVATGSPASDQPVEVPELAWGQINQYIPGKVTQAVPLQIDQGTTPQQTNLDTGEPNRVNVVSFCVQNRATCSGNANTDSAFQKEIVITITTNVSQQRNQTIISNSTQLASLNTTNATALDPGTVLWAGPALPPATKDNSPALSIVANGTSSGDAFVMKMRDPSGLVKDVKVPEGTVLEPLKREAAKKLAGGADQAAGAAAGRVLTQQVGAMCLEFAKLPPEAGMFYRVADQAVQGMYKPLLPLLRAARELVAGGKLHPDSDPQAYATSITQYAIWSELGNWDQQKFTEMMIERTRKNAEASNVKWTKEMEKALLGVAPNRWSDVVQIQRYAQKLSQQSVAGSP
jgi:hypothetical protein